MTCTLTLYIGNTNVLELRSLTNAVTGNADTGATVTATIYNGGGDEVPNGSAAWPVTLTHDTGGTYRATISEDLEVVEGGSYYAIVEAAGSGGEKGYWDIPIRPKRRRG